MNSEQWAKFHGCLKCAHARPMVTDTLRDELALSDDDPAETLLRCAWSIDLPYSWRFARREVTTVQGNDGRECPQYCATPYERLDHKLGD